MDVTIEVDDPRASDVRDLLERHLEFSHAQSPREHSHALDVSGLLAPEVTFYSARRDGVLVGVGALRRIDGSHAEIKSMHTAEKERGQGVGQAMVEHLLRVASASGYRRVSLETGSNQAFAPARLLYQKIGFRPCEPFGQYTVNPYSVCMTLSLTTG